MGFAISLSGKSDILRRGGRLLVKFVSFSSEVHESRPVLGKEPVVWTRIVAIPMSDFLDIKGCPIYN